MRPPGGPGDPGGQGDPGGLGGTSWRPGPEEGLAEQELLVVTQEVVDGHLGKGYAGAGNRQIR